MGTIFLWNIYIYIYTYIYVYIFSFQAIACERYVSIVWPLRYRDWVTSKRVRLAFIVALVYPLVILLPPMILSNTWRPGWPCFLFVIYPRWVVILITIHVFICIGLTAVIYLVIMRVDFLYLKIEKPITETGIFSAVFIKCGPACYRFVAIVC